MSTPDTPPATVQEERSRHGWVWKINTLSGITFYSLAGALLCGVILGWDLHAQPANTDINERALVTLFLFVFYMASWFLLLTPALLLRLVWGGSTGKGGGLLSACLSLLLLALCTTAAGIQIKGSLMLYIFMGGPYKLASSRFGLRSLGIPLDLPEWRNMRAHGTVAGTNAGFQFTLFWRCLYRAVWGVLMVVLFSCCFDRDQVLNAALYTLASLIPAWWAARPCISALKRATNAYLNEQPEKSLCYVLLWLLFSAGWSGILFGLLRLMIHPSAWEEDLYDQLGSAAFFFTSLAAVGIAQVSVALHCYVAKRFPCRPTEKEIEPRQASVSETSDTRDTTSRITACFFGLMILSGVIGCITYLHLLHRHPDRHSLGELRLLAPSLYAEEAESRRLPDVLVLPSCISQPTAEQQEAARFIAAYYLQDKGKKYVKRVQYSPLWRGMTANDIAGIFKEAFGKDKDTMSLCRELLPDVPSELAPRLRSRMNDDRYGVDSRNMLEEMLQAIALYRFEHPDAFEANRQAP